MARLRFDGIFGTATGNPITCPAGAGTATLTSAPGLPAISGSDFIVLIVDPGTANEDIRYAQYSGSGTSLTVGAAQEGSTGSSHAGVAWAHGPTAADFSTATPFPTLSGSGSPFGSVSGTLGTDSYLDNTNGGLYLANNANNGSGTDVWTAVQGATAISFSADAPGFYYDTTSGLGEATLYSIVDGSLGASDVALSDTKAVAPGTGSFNGVYYIANGTDGGQTVNIRLGVGGAHTWEFNANGSTAFPAGFVSLQGPIQQNFIIQSGASYAMQPNDAVVMMTAATSSVTLPDPVANGANEYTIKNAGTGTLTLHPHSSEKIDNAAGTRALSTMQALRVISDFANWWVLGDNTDTVA